MKRELVSTRSLLSILRSRFWSLPSFALNTTDRLSTTNGPTKGQRKCRCPRWFFREYRDSFDSIQYASSCICALSLQPLFPFSIHVQMFRTLPYSQSRVLRLDRFFSRPAKNTRGELSFLIRTISRGAFKPERTGYTAGKQIAEEEEKEQ